MQSAKEAVKDFLHHNGKHNTEVDSTTAPAVTNETVVKTHDQNVTKAVDREVHQDHHHTTVQPVEDRAVKAEQHHHRVAPTEERQFEHDNANDVKSKVDQERAKFQSTTRTVDGGSTTSTAPTVTGEHVHHHVHENIQPVIQRETIEPHITHTTVPVHEVHHNATKHHGTTMLPAVSREEFEKSGGSLTGHGTRHHNFAGEPQLASHSNGHVTANNEAHSAGNNLTGSDATRGTTGSVPSH